MNLIKQIALVTWVVLGLGFSTQAATPGLRPTHLRCEYLENPLGLEAPAPRLNWWVESEQRGQKQTAYRLLVASTEEKLAREEGDLWDSGQMTSDRTVGIPYRGQTLASRQRCFWKVRVWDKDGQPSAWSEAARWTMGLLRPEDWQGQWISFRDTSEIPTSRDRLFLPPARQYRYKFQTSKPVRRATVYATALGLYDLYLNGQRVSASFFTPGWADYHQRDYYETYDVTGLLRPGGNALGAVIADGWYAGYVGYGLLVGYGPNKLGRYFYGKTPAWLAQLEIEFEDGSKQVLGTDSSWRVTAQGPFREADMIMGESYDAQRELTGWAEPGYRDESWEKAIRAEENGSTRAVFHDNRGAREVELGFQKPPRLQAYPGVPVRVTGELKALRITEPSPGFYIFDLGQNFAGTIRLKAKGAAGSKLQIRYGEMLHSDGRLMTENLRRARATDFYVFRGDPAGETWTPRFTYHGFQYVEIKGLTEKPSLETVTGLVLNSDTPFTGAFACSDEVMTRFWKNTTWTQRANFIELPTDCPQRDERMGWMGDAQAYVRTASYNADVAAFYTKWLDDVEEAQRSFGAYPDYCPYPMGHGAAQKTFGTAWTDAGIICPWTLWQVYGDTRALERHWHSMTRFMEWRAASTTPEGLGVSIGNTWGDWLNVGEETPIEFVDTCYHALDCRLMAEMAEAIGHKVEASNYRQRFDSTRAAFRKAYLGADGTLKVNTQTAYVLALWIGLVPEDQVPKAATRLAEKIAANGFRMTTGFLGTKPIRPALTAAGQHDLAVRLFQSRQFPSWGYEVVNGASSVWERWDSFTKEHGFDGQNGKQNASMNSFSHYAFGAVMEWGFRDLAGIETDGAGFQRLLIRPGPPTPESNPDQKPIDWVKAEYESVHGRIFSDWKREANRFGLNLTIPPNTTATVFLPSINPDTLTENDQPWREVQGVKVLRQEKDRTVLAVESGRYRFASTWR